MRKIKVAFLGGVFDKKTNERWGGTIATSAYFKKSFENDKRFDINFVNRGSIRDKNKKWLKNKIIKIISNADIIHVDDSSLAQFMFSNNLPVDVLGPITRSPDTVKQYKKGNGHWESVYNEEWFYDREVIRLNGNEERGSRYLDEVTFISHAIPVNDLKPSPGVKKKYVLWAGDDLRYAKNFDLAKKIKNITKLPSGYQWKLMARYNVEDYWRILDETALLVNTSRYESFCSAMFEAKSKGVPVVYKKKLHNDRFLDGRVQVEYNARAYRDKILELLSDKQALKREGKKSREYAVKHASLSKMRNSYAKVYRKVLDKKGIC